MRMLWLGCLVVATTSMAQAIGGTVGATLEGVQAGSPQVRIDVNLTCALTCDASAPVKTFTMAFMRSYYAAAPTESAGFSSIPSDDIWMDGTSSFVSTSFKSGSTVFIKAESVSCKCGNRTGEGGYITLSTGLVVIPALIVDQSRARVGDDVYFSAQADLRGSEQVELKVEGGGLSSSKRFGVADLSSQGYAVWPIAFTAPGTATVTATLLPSNVSSTATWEIVARTTSATGGGAGSTGGGAGGGGGGAEPAGCSSVGGLALLAALALLRRR